MRRSLVISLVAAVVAALCAGVTTASAQPSAGRDSDRLDAYTAVVQADEIATIAQQGIDVSGQRQVANGIELDMVLDQAQADRLRGRGVDLKLTRVKGGKTVRSSRRSRPPTASPSGARTTSPAASATSSTPPPATTPSW